MPDKDLVSQDTAANIVKKKRNRPDLANFGEENVQKGDNARYLRHALEIYQLPPIDISDEKQVQERIEWFFNHCIENDMKPTVTGLCNALGISRNTINTWHREEYRGATHSDLIKKAYNLLENLWEAYMLNGKINPVSGIFLGRNNWGYQDKIDLVVTPNTNQSQDPTTLVQAANMLPGGGEK